MDEKQNETIEKLEESAKMKARAETVTVPYEGRLARTVEDLKNA